MAEYDFFKSIFPIYYMEKDKNDKYIDIHLKGTCFLCNVNENIILITASHVIDPEEIKKGNLFIFYKNNNKPASIKIEGIITKNEKEDFAFILLTDGMKAPFTHTFIPLKPFLQLLPMGHDVITFGFPLSEKEKKDNNQTIVSINPMIFKGYIHFISNTDEQQKFDTVYTLSFPSLLWLSGAPLLIGHEGHLVVAGILHQNRTVEVDGVTYDLGIASTYKPFIEIQKLITNILDNRSKS